MSYLIRISNDLQSNYAKRDEEVMNFTQLQIEALIKDSVSKYESVTGKIVGDELVDIILGNFISTEHRDSHKLLQDEKNLPRQRTSEEDKEKARMEDSINSIEKDKWAKICPVHIISEPLIEVLSVSLTKEMEMDSPSHDNKEAWEVYGNIYVDDDINECSIYERGEDDDPEIIPLGGGTLSLTGPDDFLSMDSPSICICVDLRDKVTGETIVGGSAELFKTIDAPEQNHQFEQIRTATVRGAQCSALVKYLALTFGVFCHVKVALFKQPGGNETNEEEELEIQGTISAEYHLCLSEKGRINFFQTGKDCDEYELVTWESPITLSRSVVAVPAYSSLEVQVDLMNRADNEQIVRGSCVIETFNSPNSREIIPGQKGINARVTVGWREPFMLNDPERSFISSLPWRKEGMGTTLTHVLDFGACSAVEVFSIFIGRQNDEQLSLHGMVNFSGSDGLINIFKRDKDDPYVLSPGCSLLPLEGLKDALRPEDCFMLSVDLEDAVRNVSIKGFVTSCYYITAHERSWLNRMLCSVVKGAYYCSFAAVHYSVFSYAVKGYLNVHFLFKGEQSSGTCSRIHGSVIGSYDGYGCLTSYEKLYHKIVLFKRSEENPYENPLKDFDVQLSRSVVVVPCDSFLEIEVDLSCYLSTSYRRRLKKTLMIEIGSSEGMVIQEDQVEIKIDVEWGEVRV